jgi:hypothetical protein
MRTFICCRELQYPNLFRKYIVRVKKLAPGITLDRTRKRSAFPAGEQVFNGYAGMVFAYAAFASLRFTCSCPAFHDAK